MCHGFVFRRRGWKQTRDSQQTHSKGTSVRPFATVPTQRTSRLWERTGRGLHSSTVQLNLSVFCVTGGAVRGCFGGV